MCCGAISHYFDGCQVCQLQVSPVPFCDVARLDFITGHDHGVIPNSYSGTSGVLCYVIVSEKNPGDFDPQISEIRVIQEQRLMLMSPRFCWK